MPRVGRFLLPLLCLLCLPLSAYADYFTILTVDPPLVSDAKTDHLDVRVAFGQPFAQTAVDMDPLQMFAVIRYPAKENEQSKRFELLDRLKPGKYLGKGAWAAEIPVPDAGLYQLVVETRPYWEEKRGVFIQQFAQSFVPVLGIERGWEIPVGLKLEILPLTRPFGLNSPALFTGRVLLDGKPMPGAMVRIEYLNEDKRAAQSPYHNTQAVLGDESGVFSFVCPYAGWWGFAALTKGDPLKNPEGLLKETELSGVLWIRIDSPAPPQKKKEAK